MPRYVVKKTTEPCRGGQKGRVDCWYVLDIKDNRSVTGTTYIKSDADNVAELWNKIDKKKQDEND